VLARRERRARQPPVLGHRGEDEHDVDVRVFEDRQVVGKVRRQIQPRRSRGALLGVGVEHRGDLHAPLRLQALDEAHVRRPEDAAAPDDPEPDATSAPQLAHGARSPRSVLARSHVALRAVAW
jgi:hypothetical protein